MTTKKDFTKWHGKKAQIDEIKKRPFFHEREIWHCHLGINVGFEQDGKGDDFLRPIIIFRKFNNEVFWGIPLTKADKKIKKKAEKYYFAFSFSLGINSTAILSQIKLIDARRLNNKIGEISEADFINLNKQTQGVNSLSLSIFTSALRQSRAEAICNPIIHPTKPMSSMISTIAEAKF